MHRMQEITATYVHVRKYARTHGRMYVHVYVRYVRMYVCMYVRIYVCMYVRKGVCMYRTHSKNFSPPVHRKFRLSIRIE